MVKKQKTKKLLALLTAAALALSVTLIAPLTASAATDWVVTESMSISDDWDELGGGVGFAEAVSGLSPAEGGAIEAGDTITVRGEGVVLSHIDRIEVPHTWIAENGAAVQTGGDGANLKITTTETASVKYELGLITLSGSSSLTGIEFEVTGQGTNVTLDAGAKTIERLEVNGGKLTLDSAVTVEELTIDLGANLVIEANYSTLNNVINNGTIMTDTGSINTVTGTFVNNGTLDVKADSTVLVAASKTLVNNGTILTARDGNAGAYGTRYGILYVHNMGTLENNGKITNNGVIRGEGSTVTINNFGRITNNLGIEIKGVLNNAGTGTITNNDYIAIGGTLSHQGTIINGSQTNKTAEIYAAKDGAFIFDNGTLENHAIVRIDIDGHLGIAPESAGYITVYPGSKIVRDDDGDLTNINLRALGFIVTRGSYDNETSGGDNRSTSSAADTLITGSAASGAGGGAGGNGSGEIEIFTDEEAAVKAIKESTRGTITISPSLGATARISAALSEANATVRVWLPHGNHGVMLRSTDINSKSGLKDLNFAGGRVEVPESISSRFPNASSVTGMSFVQDGDFGSVEAVTLSVKLELEPKLWGSKVAVYSVNADGSLVRLPASRIVSGNGMVSVTISNYNSLVFVV
ncbi:MAG: hypothetical protein FWG90_12630 [Oscillospiraceae bacterium]|nr:hypothetical protein [Oscillospiraceae bacterium]